MPTPRIFVSHSHQDNDWCRAFVAALQAQGVDVWYDEKGLSAGMQWVREIEHQLLDRPIFLLVISPAAWASEWVQDELALALNNRKQIIPLIHQLTAVSGFITNRQMVDAAGQAPTAAAGLVAAALGLGTAPPSWAAIERAAGLALPARLKAPELGFEPRVINGKPVITPPLASVPAGAFWMGSEGDSQAFGDEYRHQVTLGAYQIGVYPVTVAEWACAVKAGAVSAPPLGDWRPIAWADQLKRLDHPVVCVSWQDVTQYVAWLSQLTGQPWRLPTEAEWEKAARGTDGRIYPWGNGWDKTRANTSDGGPGRTTAIGEYSEQKDASLYGCHDMAGNVWEWCSSLYFDEPYQRDERRENMNDHTNDRVLRGGSWVSDPRYARAARRCHVAPADRDGGVGARLVLGAPPH